MTRIQLGLIGAVAGALLVLVIHPITKPIVQNGLFKFGIPSVILESPEVAQNSKTLPDPDSLIRAAWWINEGCKSIVNKSGLSTDQILTLVEISQQSYESDKKNAFWKQSESVFQNQLGNIAAARNSWQLASQCKQYNDYQIEKLETVLARLSQVSGSKMAWQYSALEDLKNDCIAQTISSYAVSFRAGSKALDDQVTNIKNLSLLQKGATQIASGQRAWKAIENSAIGSVAGQSGNPRETIARRFALVDELAQAGKTDDAVLVREALAANEAWVAATRIPGKEFSDSANSLYSILTSSLPGSLISGGMVSLFLAGIAFLLARAKRLPSVDQFIFPSLLGVLSGLAIFFSTGLLFPAIFLTFTFSGLLIRPKVELSGNSFPISKSLTISAGILSWTIISCVAIYAIMLTPAAETIQYCGGLSMSEWVAPGNVLSIIFILFGVQLGAIQTWAFSRSRNVYRSIGIVLSQSYTLVAWLFLIAAIVATPICIAIDQPLKQSSEQLFRDEPGYYLKNL